jgi:hypothetical protein
LKGNCVEEFYDPVYDNEKNKNLRILTNKEIYAIVKNPLL